MAAGRKRRMLLLVGVALVAAAVHFSPVTFQQGVAAAERWDPLGVGHSLGVS